MATEMYVGINSKAEKVKNIYVGINGVAKKIKKVYVGVNNIAKKVYDPVRILAYTAPSVLSEKRTFVSATSNGPYAIFSGGWTGSTTYTATTDAYNGSLTRSTLSQGTMGYQMGAAHIGNYAIFAGGMYYSTYNKKNAYRDTVLAFDTSLIRSTANTGLSAVANTAGGTIGNYAIFAGGNSGSTNTSSAWAYNSSLTRSTAGKLPTSGTRMRSASNNNYAIYGGAGSRIFAYNSSLTCSELDSLSKSVDRPAVTSINNHVIFILPSTSLVEAYDGSLTKTQLGIINPSISSPIAGSTENYAIFTQHESNTWAFDKSLTGFRPTDPSTGEKIGPSTTRTISCVANVNGYVLFGSAWGNDSTSKNVGDIVDAFYET